MMVRGVGEAHIAHMRGHLERARTSAAVRGCGAGAQHSAQPVGGDTGHDSNPLGQAC